MAMFPHHLITGEDFYIDPLDGTNKVIKCTLIQKHPYAEDIYLFRSKTNSHIYFSHSDQVYKKKPAALRLQRIRQIKKLFKLNSRPETIQELADEIVKVSYQSGESGQTIRELIHSNEKLIQSEMEE